MKSKIVLLGLLCLIGSMGSAGVSRAYDDHPVYHVRTPQDSEVPDTYMCEEASEELLTQWRADCEAYIAAMLWSAEIIGDATRAYNCHAYAWHVSEGGDDVWIGYSKATAEDIYWQDGSYVWAFTHPPSQATEDDGSKINYPSGNHSATTTGDPGWFTSKWGAWPLVRHAWDECPYDVSDVRVYRVNDNPAASVHGFAVVDGVARWKVSSEHRTSHYRIDGSQGPVGPWDELAPALPAGPGVHEFHLPDDVHSWYRLVEVETTGKEIVHSLACPAAMRENVAMAAEAQPSVEFLRERINELREMRRAEMRTVSADSDATPHKREYGSAVVFCPLDLQDAIEYAYAGFWEWEGYTVHVETIESFPADPDAFRTHLKNRIASWETLGVRYFMLVGDANDWQWFDLDEQGAEYWVGDWLDIHAGYIAAGYPPEGQPDNDVIPTFVVPDTLSRGRNLAFMTPYWMTDQPYQDVDNDGVPDVVLTRLPFSDESSVLAFCLKMQEN